MATPLQNPHEDEIDISIVQDCGDLILVSVGVQIIKVNHFTAATRSCFSQLFLRLGLCDPQHTTIRWGGEKNKENGSF